MVFFHNPNTRSARLDVTLTVQQVRAIKVLPMGRARNSDTWRRKGGMMGGSSGACAGVTSNNGMGVIPQAFTR
jgi:hypothetical protein